VADRLTGRFKLNLPVYFETSEPYIATTEFREGNTFVFGVVVIITIDCYELKVVTGEWLLLADCGLSSIYLPTCPATVTAK
jgi:hypothetical protein